MTMRTSHRWRLLAAILAAASWGACQETAVTAVDVAFVQVTPETETLRVGDVRQFQAEARDASGNTLRGRDVVWSVVDDALASVDGSGRLTALGAGETRVLARVEGAIGEAIIEIMPKPVATVEIVPAADTIAHDGTVQLAVTLRADDGSVVVGTAVAFESADPSIATVDGSGLVTAAGTGTTRITATAEGVSGEAAITVLPPPAASLSIEPSPVTVAVGATATLRIVARNDAGEVIEGHVAEWSSSAPQIATVDGGEVTGVATGTATVTATVPGAAAQVAVTVVGQRVASVTVEPASATLFVKGTIRLTATARAADGTVLTGRAVSWQSTRPAFATVDATGLVTGVGDGNVQIIGTVEGVADTAAIFVRQQQVFNVRVEPQAPSVVIDGTVQLTAILTATDGTVLSRPTTWTSSDTLIARVDANGVVTGRRVGTATITATSEGKSGTTVVTVNSKPVATVTVAPANPGMFVGDTIQLVPTLRAADGQVLTGRTVTWQSSNPAVAAVNRLNNNQGRLRALAVGSATITATSEGVQGTATVTVTLRPVATVMIAPRVDTLFPGETLSLAVTAAGADGTPITGRAASWSTDPGIFPFSSTGDAGATGTAAGVGTAVVKVTIEGVSDSALITVIRRPVAAVGLSPNPVTIAVNGQATVSVTLTDAAGNVLTGRTINWTVTGGATFASVTPSADRASAVITGLAAGTTTVTVESEGRTATLTITVQ